VAQRWPIYRQYYPPFCCLRYAVLHRAEQYFRLSL